MQNSEDKGEEGWSRIAGQKAGISEAAPATSSENLPQPFHLIHLNSLLGINRRMKPVQVEGKLKMWR